MLYVCILVLYAPTLIKSEAPRLYQAAYTSLHRHRIEVLAVPVLLHLMRTHLVGVG